jgi:hypothetical protein
VKVIPFSLSNHHPVITSIFPSGGSITLMKLIPKDGDKTPVKNWRPITLLNVSYKILAKILTNRIENILPKIRNPTQTGFVKGRYILENLITCWETLEWARSSGQQIGMLLRL